jgi:hypothetical protein
MNVSHLNAPLLTISEAAETLGEWIAAARQREEIQRTLSRLEKQLDGIVDFLPPAKQALVYAFDEDSGTEFSLVEYAKRKTTGVDEPAPLPVKIEEGSVFRAEVIRIVKRAVAGITHRQVMGELRKTEFADRVDLNESKRYYSTVGKLFKSGMLVKHGEKIYSKGVFETLQQVPGALAPPERFKEGGTTGQIVKVLSLNPGGLSASEIRDKLIEADESNRKRFGGQYVYNCLSRLYKNQVILRENSVYFPAEKATPRSSGASGVNASGQAR